MRKTVNHIKRWPLGIFIVLFSVATATAQQGSPRPVPSRSPPAQAAPNAPATPAPSPAQTPQGGAPQRTTATYNDWVLQCETQAAPASSKVCEIIQVAQVQGTNQPFSRVAVVAPSKSTNQFKII
ncbi:invasion associated locus B family protein [Bradyrhizobium diazoefficiens]|nr:invasion associated locus B family protein [Bradyrhizobium diazoefficiens]